MIAKALLRHAAKPVCTAAPVAARSASSLTGGSTPGLTHVLGCGCKVRFVYSQQTLERGRLCVCVCVCVCARGVRVCSVSV